LAVPNSIPCPPAKTRQLHRLPGIFARAIKNCIVMMAVSLNVQAKIVRTNARSGKIMFDITEAMPWLRWLAAGLSPRRRGLTPGLVHVGFAFSEFFGSPLPISFHHGSVVDLWLL
jgi:hypothetical protein